MNRSESGASPAAASLDPAREEESGAAAGPGKDEWDRVTEQLRRRPLFRLGIGMLLVLYGLAIFAPLIASDRPWRFEGIDLRAYRSASSSLRGVTSGIGRRMAQSEAEYLSELQQAGTLGQEGVPQDLRGALAEEREALRTRMDVLRSYLPSDPEPQEVQAEGGAPGPRQQLAAFESKVEGALAQFQAGQAEAAQAAIGEAKGLTRQLKRELRPLDPLEPEAGGVALVAQRSSPLVDALSPLDVFFMALWVLVALWPLWSRALGARWPGRVRRWRLVTCAAVFTLSLLAAAAFGALYGSGDNMYINAPHKAGLSEGTMLSLPAGQSLGDRRPVAVDEGVVWAPLRYGVAESHREEKFRPPTWSSSAEIDAEGRYRSASVEVEVEAGTEGELFTPIEVRAGEPARNAWSRHLLGTDSQGRDFLCRLLWGARTSLTVGILSAFLLTVIGVVIGALAGYFGGWIDVLLMRGIEILQSIPAFFLILMTMAFIPAETIKPIFAIVIVIALVRWTGTARLVRGEFLRLRDAEFVLAARALGFSSLRTIVRHLLPNAMGPVLVSAAFAVAAGILTESAISFLGFGIAPPEASWGSLVNESRSSAHWWIQLFPGLLIFLTVTCYNLVGDAIRDAIDPKLRA